jgi:hypothetical protein
LMIRLGDKGNLNLAKMVHPRKAITNQLLYH